MSLDKNERDQIFTVVEYDGGRIKNSFSESLKASSGSGFTGKLVSIARPVPVRKARFKLVGTHFSAAPISEIARRAAGTFQSISGETEFLPESGKSYEVVGELSKELSCVWIADAATKAAVSAKVCSK